MKFDPSRENLVEFLKFYSLVWFSMVWYGLVWSVRLKIHNHQSVSQTVSYEGGHRAARAAKKKKTNIPENVYKIFS